MRITLLSTLFFLSFSIIAQEHFQAHDQIPGILPSYKPAYQEDYPSWAKALYLEDPNFLEIAADYDSWKDTGSRNFSPIERYYKIIRQKILPFISKDGSLFLDRLEVHKKLLSAKQTLSKIPPTESDKPWEFLGPKETFWLNESGTTQTPQACPWQVNIYSFDVAQSDPSVLYCGTETGFINKSIDHGINWNLLAKDYAFGGGVTSIAIHPSNPNIVYAAAGKQIHKTTDGGVSWAPTLGPGLEFFADNITIDPSNTDKIYTAGSTGVHLSIDGGASWTRVWNPAAYDIHLKPDDPNIVYAISKIFENFSIAISTDGGASFSPDLNFPSDIKDASGALLAVTPAAAESLYAILLGINNTPLIYKGDMVAGSWQLVATGQTTALALDNGQGFFDLILEVSPIDPNLIFAGTSTLYKSTNAGNNFSIIGGYGGNFPIHPDMQAMKVLPNGTSWIATDGGFTFSSDNFSSTSNATARNNNLIGSDMWGFDQGWNEDLIVGGRYHNGNTAIADFYQPKALRMGGAESPTGWVMKGNEKHVAFNDLGAGWILPETAEENPQGRFIFSKYPNMDEYGGRRGNMLFHPNYYEVIYLGEGNSFWMSEDLGSSFSLLHDFGNRVRFCQIAYDNSDVIYADVVDQGLHKSDDGGLTWTTKPSLTDGTLGSAYWEGKLNFEISPTDANTLYACLQNGTWSADKSKIYKSIDGGDTWEDWSGSLDVFNKTLVIQPDSEGEDLLYLFSASVGNTPGQCYLRRHNDPDWSTHGMAYPAGLRANHALAFFRDSKIRVAGNAGVWENELDEPNFLPIVQPWVERPNYNCMLDTLHFEDHSIVNHQGVSWNWNITPSPLYIEDVNMRNPKVVLGSPGSYEVMLSLVKDGTTYSKTIANMVTATACPSLDNCDNPDFLDKKDWSLIYVDSEETGQPGLATMSFDDNPETIWHTRWSSGTDDYPHEIQIDLEQVYDIHEFSYLPRQNGVNGHIKNYELYFSDDLSDWGLAASAGEFENSAAPQKIEFTTAVVGRYFKLVALSEANGGPWSSAAEFDLKGCYHVLSSIQLPAKTEKLKAFPIPSTGLFNISVPAKDEYNFEVYNLSGQIIKRGTQLVKGNLFSLDLSSLNNGVYLIQLVDQQGRSFMVKVLKQD